MDSLLKFKFMQITHCQFEKAQFFNRWTIAFHRVRTWDEQPLMSFVMTSKL
jgi:hypothetical protein